jgi:small subunit ribosomal protein S8
MTDPIADMLTRIRNAIAAGKGEVAVPYSKMKESIAKILVENGYIAACEKTESGPSQQLRIDLTGSGRAINSLQRLSKPGRRLYAASSDIPSVLGGRGIVILSTPAGLMTGKQARKQHVGGELICKVW